MAAPSPPVALALRILVVAAAYYVGAVLGLRLALVGTQVTPLWPPTGIAVAALLLLGPRTWPGITIGALAVNIPLGPSLPAVGLIAVGNTLAPVCAYLLLTRAGFRTDLSRLKDSLALVFLGAFAGMLISAAIGSAALVMAGAVPTGRFWTTFWVWWTGDAMGVLTIAPLLLLARRIRLPRHVNPYRVLEAVGLFAGTFVVTVLAMYSPAHLFFLPFPFVIWAGLRFHQAGAVTAALIAITVAILAAARGSPVFVSLDLTAKMINLQAFNGSLALTALIHATITAERDRAREEIDDACKQLSEAVTQLSQGLPLQGRLLDVVERRAPGNRSKRFAE
ncbi:MAG TPA: MASE1 domain-containing protein [Amycolatopsis sp.]|jgi:integral membrane sensor domain MASE1|nr:MASE1 domain-containing protein [Amycolatopsis sp.]